MRDKNIRVFNDAGPDEGDAATVDSTTSENNQLIQYFYEPTKKTKEHAQHTFTSFPSNPKLRFSMDEDNKSYYGLFARAKAGSVGSKQTHSRRLSWMSAATFDLTEPLMNLVNTDAVIGEKFKLLLKPPKFDRDDILFSIHTFMSSIVDYIPSVKLDKTYQIFKDIRNLLKSTECTRLYGLLIHFCYWNIIHPAARNAIKDVKQSNNNETATSGRRRASFLDVDVEDTLPSTSDRLGLLPEILEEDNINYDYQNIQEKNRSASFIGTSPTNANNMSNIQHAIRVAKSLVQIDELFDQQVENGVDDDLSRQQRENRVPFTPEHQQAQLENENYLQKGMPEYDGDINDDASNLTSITGGSQVPYLRKESMTNIPFASPPSAMKQLTINTGAPEGMNKHVTITSPAMSNEVGSLLGGSSSQVTFSSEASLSHHEREKLFIQLETCITTLFRKMGRGKFSLVTGRQALVSCCHYIVDDILTEVNSIDFSVLLMLSFNFCFP
jgi:hypothetical protein